MPQKPNEEKSPGKAKPGVRPLPGVIPTFKKYGSTMSTENLYAIPESGLKVLQRYSWRSHWAFSISSGSFGVAVTMGLQMFTTKDSDPQNTPYVIVGAMVLSVCFLVFGLFTRKDSNEYLDDLKNASESVDVSDMLETIPDQPTPYIEESQLKLTAESYRGKDKGCSDYQTGIQTRPGRPEDASH